MTLLPPCTALLPGLPTPTQLGYNDAWAARQARVSPCRMPLAPSGHPFWPPFWPQCASMSQPAEIESAALAALLRWYRAMGVEDFVGTAPRVHRGAKPPPPAPSRQGLSSAASASHAGPSPGAQPRRAPQPDAPYPDRAVPDTAALDTAVLNTARALASGAQDLAALRAAMDGFDQCPLKRTARSLVFADGNPEADLMLVGEAPGQMEDERGLPFVGRSGQLLDRMLAAIGRDRTQAYIANILPWRPPLNRKPELTEISMCLPFLERHIALAKPRLVVALGGTAAQHLLGEDGPMRSLRGRLVDKTFDGHTVPVLATYHPAYLLRTPIAKRAAWSDFLAVQKRLETGGAPTGGP